MCITLNVIKLKRLKNSKRISNKADLSQDTTLPAETTQLLSSVRQDAKKAIDRLSRLIGLVLSSKEFRSLLKDLSRVFQDALESQGEESSSSFTRQAVETGKEIKENVDSALKSEKKQSCAEALSYHADEAKETAKAAVSQSHKPVSEALKEEVDIAAKAAEEIVPPSLQEKAKDLAGQAIDVSGTFYEQVKSGAPVAQVASEVGRDIKIKVSSYSLPPERRQEIMEKFRAAAKSINEKPEFRDGINDVLDLLSSIIKNSSEGVNSVKESCDEDYKHIETEMKEVRLCSKQLLENFAQKKSLNPLLEAVAQFQDQVVHDDEATLYLHDLRDLLSSGFHDADFLASDEFRTQFSDTLESGRNMIYVKYGDLMRRLSDLSGEYLDAYVCVLLTVCFCKLSHILYLLDSAKTTLPTSLPLRLRA